jgi:hypothetical protein
MRARRRKIQLPYPNTYESIWEYRQSFLSGEIDFVAFLGSTCPICGKKDCYRKITPYWRYAIELFPEFRKERIPIARFLCDKRQSTFSLLPTQLIPYFQYTVNAVVGTLLLGLQCRQMGQKGFHGASVAVDPESLLAPWLIACWLGVVVLGLRRAHGVLRQWYNLTEIRSSSTTGVWEEAAGYFLCFGWLLQIRWAPPLNSLVNRYSRNTRLFLFGTPSQSRT